MEICPRCCKEMKQTYHEGLSIQNPMTCEEVQECECGVTYEFAYGVERFVDENGNEL